MYVLLLPLLIVCVIARVVYLLFLPKNNGLKLKSKEKLKTAIIIGSGGHTAEMLRIVSRLNRENYTPRYYIMASSDTTSENQVLKSENKLKSPDFQLLKIPRSRHVGQSYISSVFTTLISTLYCIPLMLRHRPQLILCNGPGTCVPICLIAYFMKIVFISNPTIVFIESVCRVKTLSLTGYMLYFIADLFFVQWPGLSKKFKRTLYVGRL